MFRIAICDDVAQVCHHIEKILLAYAKEEQLLLDIEVFYDGAELSKFIKENHGFDLIYLDIEMKELSGLDVSKEIREIMSDLRTEIVFISGTTQYDRLLFDVQPLHFISKPIDAELVIHVLNLAMRKAGITCRVFTFKIGKETVRINTNDILYFESHNRQVTLVTTVKKYTYYAAMRNLMPQLPGFFCRIHNSYIINLHQAAVFQKNCVTMANGDKLPVSDNYRKDYLEYQEKELLGENS